MMYSYVLRVYYIKTRRLLKVSLKFSISRFLAYCIRIQQHVGSRWNAINRNLMVFFFPELRTVFNGKAFNKKQNSTKLYSV